eukprot:m.125259 g.125259  ORF g.125259 m.125259 type:complete len:81 (-) comp52205_c2_seq6:714-956(-)
MVFKNSMKNSLKSGDTASTGDRASSGCQCAAEWLEDSAVFRQSLLESFIAISHWTLKQPKSLYGHQSSFLATPSDENFSG